MSTIENAGGIPQWTLGDRLRKAREHAGVDREVMAVDIGRSVRTISNYESDSTVAPLLVIKEYALRTGVPLVWLSTGQAPTIDDNDPNGGRRYTGPVTDRSSLVPACHPWSTGDSCVAPLAA